MVNIGEITVGDILRDTAIPGDRIWEIVSVEEEFLTFKLLKGGAVPSGVESRIRKTQLRLENLHWIEIAPW